MVSKFAARIGKRIDAVSDETVQRLRGYSWPGNVRELENIIERAVILAQGTTLEIGPDILATADANAGSVNGQRKSSLGLEDVARKHILAALEQTDWVIDGPRGAARILELHPNTLRSRMKKLGIMRSTHAGS